MTPVPRVAFRPFHVLGQDVPLGSVTLDAAALLTVRGVLDSAGATAHLVLPDMPVSDALEAIRDTLYSAGLIEAPRQEHMPVRLTAEGETLGTIDRSALRALGLWVTKVHVNGLVRMEGGPEVWLSRRARHAAWNPDRFDTLVAGGVAAGQNVSAAVQAESWEEAGLLPEVVATRSPARQMAVQYVTERGLHRELLVIHDLELDPEFIPRCQDGEIEWARRVDLDSLQRLVDLPGEMKFSSALVCADLLDRLSSGR